MGNDEALEPEQARQLVASNEATVLDIRDDDAWHEKRIPGAQHASQDDLDATLEDVDDDRTVMIVCEDGERSAEVAAELREDGREAKSIEGGMRAWEKEKFPLQPSTDPDDDVDM